ncbi:MAG: ABC transporter substrate-binding protein [Gammaproteobacteria bacterium]|nr:ABC transporter substrate-binding protein [Gammaproteobacteria bacterium]
MKRLLTGLALCGLAGLPGPAAWANPAGGEVAASVDAFHAVLLDAMQTQGFAQRAALLEPAVAAFFDLEAVARISLGASWRSLAEERRSAFVDLMRRLITATYADRFDSYSGQSFVRAETVTASTGPVVKTLLNRSNDEPVNLDYYFRGGKAFNVVADGVSDLSLRRADYAGIIRAAGHDGLVADIEASIAELWH